MLVYQLSKHIYDTYFLVYVRTNEPEPKIIHHMELFQMIQLTNHQIKYMYWQISKFKEAYFMLSDIALGMIENHNEQKL